MKRIIKNLALKLGYRIIKANPNIPQHFTAGRIMLIGSPKTVVDVGVAGGTFELYDAFPEAQIVLVEPLPDLHKCTIDKINSSYDKVTLLPVAAGTEAADGEINIETASLEKSSLLVRSELTKEPSGTERRKIKIERLDELLEKGAFPGPFGIKIDTEGFELNVVKGVSRILSQVEFFIVEVSIAKRFEHSYSFAEFVGYMDSVGFEVTDMLSFARPDRVGTRYLDLVFKRKG